MSRRGLALRFAVREMRGGLAGFRVFVACIALGVAAIAGVSSVARLAGDTIAREGQAILGGDIAFELAQREASPDEMDFIAGLGAVSRATTLRAMARLPDASDQTLIELKAVDGAYPLYGALTLADGGDPAAALANGIVAEASLLTRLDLKVGDEVMVGTAPVVVAGVLANEPDRLSDGLNWGPRVLIAENRIAATGLVQPGSLVRNHYRVRLAPGTGMADIVTITDTANERFPNAGWRIETREDSAPGLQRRIGRLTDFLTLVGLTALMVGGIGVGNAVAAYLAGKREVIATFRCLGADGDFVVAIYLAQIAILALVGIVIGLVIGTAIPFLAIPFLGNILPLEAAPRVYPGALALAALYGAATALAFALPPLGRAREVEPTSLFRDQSVTSRRRLPNRAYVLGSAAALAVLVTLAILLAHSRNIAIAFVVGAAGAFILLSAIAWLIVFLAGRAPRTNSTGLRLALANIHRPGSLTPSIIRSLGIGLTLIATLILIDGNIRRELTQSIPEQAPSFYFLDIANTDYDAFTHLIGNAAPGSVLDHVPMLRGRVVTVKGVPAETAPHDPEVGWVLRGDRGVTFAATRPDHASLAAGTWWDTDYDGPPLVSMEAGAARGLHLAVGDTIEVNVLGRIIEAKVANLREVDWDSLAINFVMVFSPSTFRGAPYRELATLTLPATSTAADETAILRAVGAAFPTVTAIRVKEALDRVNDLLGQVTTAILAASGVTLATAMLVLAGALSAGHRRRLYEAVILKTLGATRRRIVGAFALEYLLLALATAVFAIAAGAVAAAYVLTELMRAEFTFLAGPAVLVTLLAVALTVGLGLAGTWRILAAKPAGVLRNL